MPTEDYGVLKGRAMEQLPGRGSHPHYFVRVSANNIQYRVSVAVKSRQQPSELKYFIEHDFHHPICEHLSEIGPGFTKAEKQPDGLAVDYIRGNLLNPNRMLTLSFDVPGPDNDLNEKIDAVIMDAIRNESADMFVFGHRYGPIEGKSDRHFGFKPRNGMHDVHMNQGATKLFRHTDGVWEDGAIMVHFRDTDRWAAIFLAFQSQSFHTDDRTGHRLGDTTEPDVIRQAARANSVRIVAAMVNPPDGESEDESVTIINCSPDVIDLAGWKLVNKRKKAFSLSGKIESGVTRVVDLPHSVKLSNKGGTITLLDSVGLKVHGVAYSKRQAAREGWTIVFQ